MATGSAPTSRPASPTGGKSKNPKPASSSLFGGLSSAPSGSKSRRGPSPKPAAADPDDLRPPTVGQLQVLSRKAKFTRLSENQLSNTQKNKVFQVFCRLCRPHFESDSSLFLAWGNFLLFLADCGFSESASSKEHLVVTTINDTGEEFEEMTETFDDILDELQSDELTNSFITNRRIGIAFCNEIATLLEARGRMTNYGISNHMPKRFIKYSFPGAEFCDDIPDDARKALSACKTIALSRVQTGDSSLSATFTAPESVIQPPKKVFF